MEDCLAVTSWESPVGLIEYYAIFDGHGGQEVSSFVQSVFHSVLQEKIASSGGNNLKASLLESFAEVNDQAWKLLQRQGMINRVVGSTGVVVIINNGVIHCANLGDSRAIIVSQDPANAEGVVGTALSFDHKPSDREEEARIKRAGGFIASSAFEGGHYRVLTPTVGNGLGVARAFGDFPLAPAVGDQPYYHTQALTPADLFIVVGCDGIWDVLSNQEAAEITHRQAKRGIDSAAHTLRGWALAQGSADDLSVISVQL